MKLNLTQDDLETIKHDLVGCLNLNIHGHILGTKQRTLSKMPLKMRKQVVDSLFAYLSAYDENDPESARYRKDT